MDIWSKLVSLGIRKPCLGKRAGRNRRTYYGLPVSTLSTGLPLSAPLSYPGGSQQLFFPNIIYSNVRSIASKMDELQAVVDNNNTNIVTITQTWLNDIHPDSIIHLSDFIHFRRDRPSCAGGVCIYIRSSVPCSRIYDFETLEIESLWIKLRPHRLPRHVLMILVAVVYHSTSCGADDNRALLQHLQVNTGSFLQQHPEGLLLITGDFNPASTGLSLHETTCITNLSQIIKALTRDSGILDWCLTNRANLFTSPKQLLKLGTRFLVLLRRVLPRCRLQYQVLSSPRRASSWSMTSPVLKYFARWRLTSHLALVPSIVESRRTSKWNFRW